MHTSEDAVISRAVTIREHIRQRVRTLFVPVYLVWAICACLIMSLKKGDPRLLWMGSTWVCVLIGSSYATRLIRCPRCHGRLGSFAAGANIHGKWRNPPTAHNCPHCLVHFDQEMPSETK